MQEPNTASPSRLLPRLLRPGRRHLPAIVACGWFGVQTWLGGQAVAAIAGLLWPHTLHMPWIPRTCFPGFWLLNMAAVWSGVESIRFLQSISAPVMLLLSFTILVAGIMIADYFLLRRTRLDLYFLCSRGGPMPRSSGVSFPPSPSSTRTPDSSASSPPAPCTIS